MSPTANPDQPDQRSIEDISSIRTATPDDFNDIQVDVIHDLINESLEDDMANNVVFHRQIGESISLESLMGGPNSLFNKKTLEYFSESPWILLSIASNIFNRIYNN